MNGATGIDGVESREEDNELTLLLNEFNEDSAEEIVKKTVEEPSKENIEESFEVVANDEEKSAEEKKNLKLRIIDYIEKSTGAHNLDDIKTMKRSVIDKFKLETLYEDDSNKSLQKIEEEIDYYVEDSEKNLTLIVKKYTGIKESGLFKEKINPITKVPYTSFKEYLRVDREIDYSRLSRKINVYKIFYKPEIEKIKSGIKVASTQLLENADYTKLEIILPLLENKKYNLQKKLDCSVIIINCGMFIRKDR